MLLYICLGLLLACAYTLIISRYIYYWQQLLTWDLPRTLVPQTKVTVLVAARNEATQIEACLAALSQQKYPEQLLEIILIDDHSEDATAQLAAQYAKVRVLSLPDPQTGKKAAIAYGISQSSGQLIVTTDADCIMANDWLLYLVSFYEAKQPAFIAAPVTFYEEQSLLERFQSLDFMGMMGIAGAGVQGEFMQLCNGANLAYERQIFEAVGGFEGIDHVASGDDMLLMQKIAAQNPKALAYLKQAAAQTRTKAKPTWKAFIQQRVRWGSKSSVYTNWQTQAILGVVWLLCVTCFVDLLLGYFWPLLWGVLVLKLFVKAWVDFFLLNMMADFFDRHSLMRVFVPAFFIHCWYIAWVGTLSLFQKEYTWKGRRVK